jgi:ubiquinone/menaquinone biosynthesis C-methylase UbiE
VKDPFYDIYGRCEKEFKEEELWPQYFKKRYLEFLSFYDLFRNEKMENVLEIGCGIGYYSLFLAKISGHLTATDLDTESKADHAIGLAKTQAFISHFNCNNISITPASAEDLPFTDNSFDLIFSSHVLEHVPDREKALREIHRTLKPNGVFVCITPSRADRFYALFSNYFYLAGRLFSRAFKKQKSQGPASEEKVSEKVSKNLKHLFTPPVHGAFKSYGEEFRKWSFGNWRKLLLSQKGFSLMSHTSSELNPLANISYYISPAFSVMMLGLSRKVDSWLGKAPFIKTMGVNSILIIRKTG